MLKTFRKAFQIEEIRKKIFYTFAMLFVVRLGSQLPTPGVDPTFIQNFFANQTGEAFNFFNAFTGGSFEQMSIFALSITPYITSSIIMQLLTIAIPKLEEMQKDGEEGRKKIASLISSSTHLKQSIIKESLNKIDNEFIEKITKIIEENLMDEKIDVPTIAQELSMSYSSLYRKVKALTGMSTGEFIRKLRLRKAEQLLLSGKYNISEIAHQVGLNSVSYFRECFKEEYGMSPSEYIKQLK